VEIIIYKEGWSKPYKFKARNFGTSQEEIIETEEIKE